MTTENKLASNLVWLFALATLVLAIGATYLVPHLAGPLSPKVMGGIYFAVFGTGATAAAYFTRAGALGTIGPFVLASAGIGIFYYAVVSRAAEAAAESLGATSGGGFATGAGLLFAGMFFVASLAGGIAGGMFGLKLRLGLGSALRTQR